jgi:hypothetical protein
MTLDRVTAGIPSLSGARRTRIATREKTRELHRQRLVEELERSKETVVKDGDIATTSVETQLGKPLSSLEIEKRLKACNPNLHFESAAGDRSKKGVYLVRRDGKQFICGMEAGYSPEFSVRHAEKVKVPDPDLEGGFKETERFTKETRGWRTVLARVLRSRAVNPLRL